jgi:hypothetical protein
MAGNLHHKAKIQLQKQQPITRLKQLTAASCKDSENVEPQLGLVILQRRFLCAPVLDCDRNTSNLTPDAALIPINTSAQERKHAAHKLHDASSAFHRNMAVFQQQDDIRRLPTPTQFCQHDNQLCPVHDIKFKQCLAEQHADRIANEDVFEQISENCCFKEEEVTEMSVNRKLDLLRWWFATNACFVKGARKRKEI